MKALFSSPCDYDLGISYDNREMDKAFVLHLMGIIFLDFISKFTFIQEIFQGDNERGDKENLGTSSKY